MSLSFLRLARLPFGEAARPERRKAQRQSADCPVFVISSAGERSEARLHDISPHGCNLSSEAEWLRLGKFVTLRLDEERSLPAIVRWARDGVAGVEFLRPIPETEVAEFAAFGD